MHALNASCRPFYEALLTLDGLDGGMPSPEELAQKKASAMTHLADYIERCGGKLPAGWDCAVRCRVTSRRSGKQGLTSDNFYYSPCGSTFRSHREVAEFLGLPHAPEQQPQHPAVVLNTDASVVCDSDAPALCLISGGPASSAKRPAPAVGQCEQPAAKRPAVAATAAAPRLCTPLPAAAVTAASAGMSGASCQTGEEEEQRQSMPPPPPQPVRRTKQMLAAKYAGCGLMSSVSANSSISTEQPAEQASVQSDQSPVQQQQQREPVVQLAAAPAVAQQPTASASSSGCITAAPCAADSNQHCSSNGASSASTAAATCALQQRSSKKSASKSKQQQQQQASKQQEASKPHKPKRQPEWRTKLRLLATQMAVSNGVLSSSNSTSSALECTASGPAEQQQQQ